MEIRKMGRDRKQPVMTRACPICSGVEKARLYSQNFNNKVISLMEKYDVVACKECGFVYADNIPSQSDFNHYYEVMSKYEFDYKDGVVSEEYLTHFTKIYDFIAPHLKDRKARILDVGCSTGALLSIFKSNGYSNLSGIDPSPACAMAAEKVYNIKAEVGSISGYITKDKFDLIILSAVLEHLVDLDGSMPKIRELLDDRGLLFVEVPDAERFDSFVFTPFQQFSIEHINYFSQYSIKNLMSRHSFSLIDIKKSENRINESTDPDIYALAIKSKETVPAIDRDGICESRIRNYISECSKIEKSVKRIISEKLSGLDKVIVWGVGTHTQRLIGSGLELSKILYFVDSNTRYKGKKIKGIEIKAPGDIKENNPILISTYSYQEEIAGQIRKELGLNNKIIKIYGRDRE